jgi:hypothetical protein
LGQALIYTPPPIGRVTQILFFGKDLRRHDPRGLDSFGFFRARRAPRAGIDRAAMALEGAFRPRSVSTVVLSPQSKSPLFRTKCADSGQLSPALVETGARIDISAPLCPRGLPCDRQLGLFAGGFIPSKSLCSGTRSQQTNCSSCRRPWPRGVNRRLALSLDRSPGAAQPRTLTDRDRYSRRRADEKRPIGTS